MKKTLAAVGMFCFQAAIVLVMLFAAAFDRGFYISEYQKLGVYESCGADSDTLERATDITIDYLKGKADDMSGAGTIDGAEREIFGEDERSHMVDVKWLFQTGLLTALGCCIVAAVCMIAAGRGGDRFKRDVAKGALVGIGAFAVLLGAFAAWCVSDFNGAFNAFHHLLFRNGLWLMNPDTQFMIRMFPAQFFSDMGARIAAYVGIAVAAEITLICFAGFGGRRKHEV